MTTVHVVLFTADLRVHDHPPLHSAVAAADEVVPLFVRDPAVDAAGFAAPNRTAFLADCLADLHAALRARGGRLVLRSGETAAEVARVVRETGAAKVHVSSGWSGFARRREQRIDEALGGTGCLPVVHEGVNSVAASGDPRPAGKDFYAVFTPYHRRWTQLPVREPLVPPDAVRVPQGLPGEALPARPAAGALSPGLPRGGESEARRLLDRWLAAGLADYDDLHDALAQDATSHLSPHLHFGSLSAVEAAHRAQLHGGPGAEAFVRQLAWRDFHAQVLAARPDAARHDLRPRGDRWRQDAQALRAWQEGRTGYPVVDAGMRQLAAEGWMHNRARLLTASFLTKTLYLDWRLGAAHFLSLLVDGDVANNQLNWQWVAGTGTDTRPNRVLNPVVQGRRFDPDGAYVRRWVPELADVPANRVHEPWRLPERERKALDYPPPIVDLGEGLARFRLARS